ncbi:MAG: trypsin-like peptidase domain-containing protein [Verrucomicrobia bacterium]|nr:trypsin-like peptidase domain-containing protein [Verrucomicrobiota bacterium]
MKAVEKALPSVVNIGTEKMVKVRYLDPMRKMRGSLLDEYFKDFFGPPMPGGYRMASSLGSGVIVDPRGYILTNYHVIERASRIRVTLADGRAFEARVLAGDDINDLGLIKIDPDQELHFGRAAKKPDVVTINVAGAPLEAIAFAEDDDLLLGESVIVLGNPFGLGHTVTVGVLSAKNREATYEGEVLYRDILQTDAAVNPGSSGGPLLNADGDLIGINVAIYRQGQNIGFAVPVKRARALLARWFSPRLLKKLWLGFDALYDGEAVIITAVSDEGPADRGGLQVGDIVKSVAGIEVRDLFDFSKALLDTEEGTEVPIIVSRGEQTVSAELLAVAIEKPSGELLGKSRLGLEFSELKDDPEAGFNFRSGVKIREVTAESPAESAGLRAGLVITRINDFEIQSIDDVGLALERIQPGDDVSLVVVNIEERDSFVVAQSSTVELKAQ